MNKIIVQNDQARLYGRPYPIPQGQSQFSEIEFSFSEEWANLRKIAQFEQKNGPYNVDISDNKCFCPPELVKGWVNIRVKGYPEDTTSAVIATANEIILPVSMGFKPGGTPSVPPTPDLYQKLIGEFSDKVQSDWNQNDPTAKDYVRNRTHYVSQENGVIVPEQEVTTAVQNNLNAVILNSFDSDALQKLYDSKDDTTLDVVFDGASYPCKWLEEGGNRIPVFGNLAILNPSVTDTGEPFAFFVVQAENDIAITIICKVAGTHTVAVSYQQDVVHTLDRKYMPAVLLNGTTGEKINRVNVYDQANADDWIDDTININLIPVFTDGGRLLQQLSDERSAFFTLKFKKSSSISISQGDWETGELVDLPQNVKDYLRNVCTNPHYHVSCNLNTIDSSGNTSVHTCGVAFHTGSYKGSVLYGVGTYWDEQYLVHVKLDLSKSPPEIKWKGIRD